MNNIPPKSWFKAMDIFHSKKYLNDVLNDLEQNSDIKLEENIRDSFVKFACLERMTYEADIREELKEYYKKKKNMSVSEFNRKYNLQ